MVALLLRMIGMIGMIGMMDDRDDRNNDQSGSLSGGEAKRKAEEEADGGRRGRHRAFKEGQERYRGLAGS